MKHILDEPITSIHQMILKGQLSFEELMAEVVAQIALVEKDVQAYITLNLEDAQAQAIELDKRVKLDVNKKEKLARLAGIPVSIKDTFVTKGIRTTVASRMLEDFLPDYDATSYFRVKDSGSLIVGKTNMDEFAHGFTCEYSAFHPTKNPWNLEMVPGGSSGGAAASVASRTSLLALASENFGSIVQPAALCGLVGVKPTYGRASRYGIIAMASSLESPGIIARCVEDAALGIEAISGMDPLDQTTLDAPKEQLSSKLSTDAKGKRLAIVKPLLELVDTKIAKHLEEAVKIFSNMGVSVEEIDWYDLDEDLKIYDVLYRSEVASNLSRYDGIRYGYRSEHESREKSGDENSDKLEKISLEDFYARNRSMFGPHVRRQIDTSPLAINEEHPEHSIYYQVLKLRRKNQKYIDRLFKKYDGIVMPAAAFTELKIGQALDQAWRSKNRDLARVNGAAMCPTVLYGYPAISFPIGFSKSKMPVGIHLFGKRMDELGILNIAYAFQEHTGLKCLNPYKKNI